MFSTCPRIELHFKKNVNARAKGFEQDCQLILTVFSFVGGLSVFRRHHSHLCTGATFLTTGEAHGSLLPPPRSAPPGGRTPCHLSWNTPQSFSNFYLRDFSHTQKVSCHEIEGSSPILFLLIGNGKLFCYGFFFL